MKRKKEDIDLSFHSIMVANMLKKINHVNIVQKD